MKGRKDSSLLIVDCFSELKEIEEQFSELSESPIILLSSSFNLQQLDLLNERDYSYFDEYIDAAIAKEISIEMNALIWSWFLDENDEDVSAIDGCSLGSAFSSSLEILFNTIFRYYYGLKSVITSEHCVYYVSNTEEIFIEVIKKIQQETNCQCISVYTKNNMEENIDPISKQVYDYGYRKRDLSTIFNKKRLKNWLRDNILYYCLLLPQQLLSKLFVGNSNDKVFIFDAGKNAEYIDYIKQHNTGGFDWVLPVTKITDIISGIFSPNKYHFFSSTIPARRGKEISVIVDNLRENIRNKKISIDTSLIVNVMNRHTFPYFYGAFKYYKSGLRMFKVYKPSLVISPTDFYENYILLMQAAKKCKITTAQIPHGLIFVANKQYRQGRFKIFDYALAIGNMDVENYLSTGFNSSNIRLSSLPYFTKFIPIKNKVNPIEYRKALIASPDVFNTSPIESVGAEYEFYKMVVNLLDELNIHILGIKSRSALTLRNIGITDDFLIINNKKIPLLLGGFPDAIKDADLIIGPAASSLIESGLLGKDYYTYQHVKYHNFSETILPVLDNIVEVAYNNKELKDNVLNRRTYKDGYSVLDLVSLDNVETKQDLYDKFEDAVDSILIQDSDKKNEA